MDNMQLIFGILSFLFGAIVGSFLNVVILRLPEDQKLTGRSYCPVCLRQLMPRDLVPIASFLWLGGHCRFCKAKISKRYIVIECITGLLFLAFWIYLKPNNLPEILLLAKYWLAAASLVAVFVIDFEHYLILDAVIFPASAALALLNLALDLARHQAVWNIHSQLVSGLLAGGGLAAIFFLIWYLSKGRWLGFGDVKLAIFLGLILGWPLVLIGFMIAVILGGIVSLFLLALTPKTLTSQVPFGTFLSLGTVLALFWGHQLLSWYLWLLGF